MPNVEPRGAKERTHRALLFPRQLLIIASFNMAGRFQSTSRLRLAALIWLATGALLLPPKVAQAADPATGAGRLNESFGTGPAISVPHELPRNPAHQLPARNLVDQTAAEVLRKSRGCFECHQGTDTHTMHRSPNVVLGCTDCHGGDPTPGLMMRTAHVQARYPDFWQSSANPSDSSVLLNKESAEFIRFVNPGDLRVAELSCGPCHGEIVRRTGHSIMRHGAMLWGAALYNNGAVPHKNPRFGQAYGPEGVPLRLESPIPITEEMTREFGLLPFIEPLPRFPLSQPSNTLRIFEKGGEKPLDLGSPYTTEPPGRPLRRLSERGLGTKTRIDPVFLNLQKTRLHDPLLDFMGSNDHPGDYRSSGCSACHVVYANDRSPHNSGWYAKYGHQGLSFSGDAAIPKNERGHPIKHEFTRAIPSAQCMNCHMHQGNLFVNPFLGYTWWDQESDGEFMYPKEQRDPAEDQRAAALHYNPEEAAARGLWGNPDFLDKVAELNPQLKQTQFADYHGHGWVFRAVFKKDKQGNLVDLDDRVIPHDDTHKWAKAVHLKDVHLARGMQCADCHFDADVHGNGLLYGEPRAATTIECIDCHGTVTQRPTLITSGSGGRINAKTGQTQSGIDLAKGNTPGGARFYWEGRKLFQRSTMAPDVTWEVPQTIDTLDPKSSHYNPKSAYAKTLRRNGANWGDVPAAANCARELAHDNANVSCQICHTSWATSCFGCHLPMKANQREPLNKFEGILTRNYTGYNPQVVRDDVFQLGIDATYKSNRLAVLRSSSAVIVGSQNANREWIYSQQQTVSAEGYSGQAYNPHFPHTTSSVGTTKNCTDCHLAKDNNNVAWMTQLLGFGTGTVNFFGRYAWAASGDGGLDGVVWTERDEPQAALGSHLHQLAYPRNFEQHTATNHLELQEAHHHHGEIRDLTLRGEYLYTAGKDGLVIYDVANIDNKGFSERIVTAPVSPLGQRLYVRTKDATSLTLPSTLGIDPLRARLPENEEQPISLIYAWVFVTDRKEGLVMTTVGTLVDGAPDNNFLDREKTIRFNPGGKLTGAMHSYMAGTNLVVVGPGGLFVLGLSNTELKEPALLGELPAGGRAAPSRALRNPRALAVLLNYAFVADDDGVKVVDLADPAKPRLVPEAFVPLKQAGRLYAARSYLYAANGAEGLAIIDIANPEKPRLDQMFHGGGLLTDTRAVQVGSINASMYALVADGRNGLRVVQLISPDTVPGHLGFSPRPNPKVIATFPTKGEAIAISRGLDRDRVVDETGNQTVVFGRRGARPFNQTEFAKFLRHSESGAPNRVEDVVIRDGQITLKSGAALKPTATYRSAEELIAAAPAARKRLIRR